jgi:hypothetical protein
MYISDVTADTECIYFSCIIKVKARWVTLSLYLLPPSLITNSVSVLKDFLLSKFIHYTKYNGTGTRLSAISPPKMQ